MKLSRLTLFLCLGLTATLTLARADSASIILSPTRAIAPDLIGINGNLLSLPDASQNEDFLQAFRSTHAGLFRYPAGTIANTWDWDIGGLDPSVAEKDLIGWVQKLDRSNSPEHPHGIPEIARIQHATGATIAFVLNMLSKDLEHSLRGLRRARDAGIPIKYVEMGNELYFNLRLESRVFPTPEAYGRICSEWIRAIKAEFPGAQCALVAGGKMHNARSKNWIERALAHCPEADAIVVHTYSPSGLTGPIRKNVTAGTEGTVEVDENLSLIERQSRELAQLNTSEGIATTMVTAYHAADSIRAYTDRTHLPIWLTEWNLRADHDAFRGTWAHALFSTTFLHGILENPAVEITHYHNVVSPIFGAFYQNDQELQHVVALQPQATPWNLTAGGMGVAFFGRVATGRVGAREIEFSDSIRLQSGEKNAPSAYGWQFHQPDGQTSSILVNLGPVPLTLNSEMLGENGTMVETFSSAPDTYIESNSSVTARQVKLGPKLVLPPLSVTLVNPTPNN